MKKLLFIRALLFTLALLVSLLLSCGKAPINTIAFMSDSENTGLVNIYLADLSGENLTRCTGDLTSGYSNQPAWSPGGDRIAFFTPNTFDLGNDIHTLHIIDNRGNDIASIDDIPGSPVSDPVWSPDASKIAFYSNNEDDTFSVYMTDGNGKNLSLLDTVPGTPQIVQGNRQFTPLWSPDSSKVCVNSMIHRFDIHAFESVDEGAVYVIDTQGNRIISLEDIGMGYWQSRWSPDGGKISFCTYAGERHDLHVINADGTGSINITEGNYGSDISTVWLPDSDKIIFTSKIDDNHDAYIVNSDGTGLTRIAPDIDSVRYARPSPDGSKIILAIFDNNNYEYYVIGADGSGLIKLQNDMDTVSARGWSPDSSKIVFTSLNQERTQTLRDRVYDIQVINADGTGLITVASDITELTYLQWFPDSERIIFRTGSDGSYSIYVVNVDGTGLINLTDDLGHNWGLVVPPVER